MSAGRRRVRPTRRRSALNAVGRDVRGRPRIFYMVSMMGDINIVYINIDFLNETFFMTFTLSRILSGLANFSTERSETFRITL